MNAHTALVVTSIAPPTQAMRELAAGCINSGISFFVIGDSKSPSEYSLQGAEFFSLQHQRQMEFAFARLCPERHYARKNLGYLLAITRGAATIIETDDDNLPMSGFWEPRRRKQTIPTLDRHGWSNVYAYFTKADCWPRGLPLNELRRELPPFESLASADVDCPIQQGLADEDPDVDAIFRLLYQSPIAFTAGRSVAFRQGTWCPFNSQNTTWFPDAYPLLYLPAYCSIRMTDIWRSFIAQRIAWTNGWSILFHSPTVYQLRNEHDLMRDFRDEIPGYLNNNKIAESLENLDLASGVDRIGDNLLRCYEALVTLDLVDQKELALLDAWLTDLAAAGLHSKKLAATN